MIEEKDKDFSVYEVPLSLVDHGLDSLIVRKLGLTAGTLNLDQWHDLLDRLRNPQHEVTIAVVGKYTEHRDAYKSIYEALDHAGVAHRAQVSIQRLHSEQIEREGAERLLAGVDGVLVPGGFGERGIEGKVDAIRFVRERGIPFFGVCLGMQCAVVEFARNVLGLEHAQSTEFDKNNPHPVICLLEEQKGITEKGGTMRLGAQPACLRPGSNAAKAYGSEADIRAAPPSLRVQQRLSRAVRGGGHVSPWGRVPTARWWRSSRSAVASRGSWPCNITRNSSRSPRGRTRCSPVSSAQRCGTGWQCRSRRVGPDRERAQAHHARFLNSYHGPRN